VLQVFKCTQHREECTAMSVSELGHSIGLASDLTLFFLSTLEKVISLSLDVLICKMDNYLVTKRIN
jgi:hypothetical protein